MAETLSCGWGKDVAIRMYTSGLCVSHLCYVFLCRKRQCEKCLVCVCVYLVLIGIWKVFFHLRKGAADVTPVYHKAATCTLLLFLFYIIVSSGYNSRASEVDLFIFVLALMTLVLPLSLSPHTLSRMCVSECPSGFFRDDKKRCKKCSSLCETCVGSRSDQCTTCRTGFHLSEGANTCVANCADSFYLDHGAFYCWPN